MWHFCTPLEAPCQSSSWHSRKLEATANVVVVPGTAVKRCATVPERIAGGRPEACKCRSTSKARIESGLFQNGGKWYNTTSKIQTETKKKSRCQLSKDPKTSFFRVFWVHHTHKRKHVSLLKTCGDPVRHEVKHIICLLPPAVTLASKTQLPSGSTAYQVRRCIYSCCISSAVL